MAALPDDLRAALDGALSRYPQHQLSQAVDRLSQRYRAGTSAVTPILGSALDVAAYAGYRMPATYAAVRSMLGQLARLAPDFAPRSQLDLGGGTGAAVWAAADVWPSLTQVTVLEQAPEVISLGQRLATAAESPVLRAARWQRAGLGPELPPPTADLVTLSYVLGELPEPSREALLRWMAAEAPVLALIEPGTPDGYARIVAARALLIGLGRTIVAPCPHDGECPIPRGKDWCHFSVRLPRTGLHRTIKAGSLGFEDEKFSYLVAVADPWASADNRVLRHPQKRKGHVALRLCTGEDGLADVVVSKRQGDRYRAARDASWGDDWPA